MISSALGGRVASFVADLPAERGCVFVPVGRIGCAVVPSISSGTWLGMALSPKVSSCVGMMRLPRGGLEHPTPARSGPLSQPELPYPRSGIERPGTEC